MLYQGKALAKEAAARACLEDGIIEKIKEYMVKRVAPRSKLARRIEVELGAPEEACIQVGITKAVQPPTTRTTTTSTSKGGTADTHKEANHGTWVSRLDGTSGFYMIFLLLRSFAAYCISTGRPSPCFVETTRPDCAAISGGDPNVTNISAQVSGQTFELDLEKASTRGSSAIKEKLARMILRHFQKREEIHEKTNSV